MKGFGIFLFLAGIVFAVEVIETPEETVPVSISLKDVNRIVCVGGDIEFTTYSKEKRIEVKREKNNVFVKIVPKLKGQELVYERVPRELYIGCGLQTFSLLLLPKDVPAKTIYLKPPYENSERAREYEREDSYLTFIKKVFRDVYMGVVPDGYRVTYPEKKTVLEFEELSMSLHRIFKGSRYLVEEYVIVARKDMELDESAFIPFLKDPLALTITRPKLRKNESARVIVLRRR